MTKRSRSRRRSNVDVWQTPLIRIHSRSRSRTRRDPALDFNREAMKVPRGIKFATSQYAAIGEWKLLASTEGTRTSSSPSCGGPVLGDRGRRQSAGEFESNTPPDAAHASRLGIRRGLVADATRGRIGEQAVEKLTDAPGRRTRRTDPRSSKMGSRSTSRSATDELDRRSAPEAKYAGTSFASPTSAAADDRLAATDVFADKTHDVGLATWRDDDDAWRPQRWWEPDRERGPGQLPTSASGRGTARKAFARHRTPTAMRRAVPAHAHCARARRAGEVDRRRIAATDAAW